MELRNNKLDKAATQNKQKGPVFGEGDITIDMNAASYVSSSTNLHNSYEFPSGLSLSADERDRLLAGSTMFVVDEMEVFNYIGKTKGSVFCSL